ncbi:hypothetical protein [Xenorhabdus szentirmaii]|uniref:Uncharacterized protein n=1 Tax=Xenorhabdus szentirmaii DSM 16338 TaxID=1427518 RepID=W1IY95_9GAMM|nr:hypothetical protein [Xenorhabdus szentirmaii]PHM34535.1 hypothetical protein Xsze_00965 [Xenorhabdus szentirmaii DSM 16338]PHM43265.1 hypothetical protein Xszus_03051 [Xenorhabdus szentirmaii]CDL82813.1 conserved hypothetical protein [Xenorhabdus szentirmaii DSM 16338]
MPIEFNEEQYNKLKIHAFNAYLDELLVNCNESYPHIEIKLGKEGLRTALTDAVEKAKNDGFDQRGPVQFYIDMYILFGTEFQTDPQYTWIKTILDNHTQLGQLEITTLLYHEVTRYFNEIQGEQDEYLKTSVSKLQNINIEGLNVQWNTYESNVDALLNSLYPQKYQYIKQNDVKKLIQFGVEKSGQYGMGNANESAFLTLIMFLLGHQFDQDIFLPHLNKKLFNQYYSDTDSSVIKIEKAVKDYLKIFSNNIEI